MIIVLYMERKELEGKAKNLVQLEKPRKVWRQYSVCLKLWNIQIMMNELHTEASHAANNYLKLVKERHFPNT